jgi:hypothetical protein
MHSRYLMRRLGVGLLVAVLGAGCTLDRQLHRSSDLHGITAQESPYLKAHLKNGDVVVFSRWTVDDAKQVVRGDCRRWDTHRQTRPCTGPLAIDEVALFETNQEKANLGPVVGLTIVTVASLAVTVACLVNPKACFGSCPTFYISDGQRDYLAAEGFSESVAPALEATDVDAMWRAHVTGRTARLRITNEALETHTVKQAHLLVVPRPEGGRIVRLVDGQFREARDLVGPRACRAAEGDCLPAVAANDELERISETDGRDLATRESVELRFDDTAPSASAAGGTSRGLLIEARQGFITTYLFYQALAYMGRKAGSYLAALEQGDEALRQRTRELYHLLGGIDVQVRGPGGDWRTVGSYLETGPLAREVQVVPLPDGAPASDIRLVMARGHFRLGHVALVRLGQAVTPTRVPIARIATRAGDAERARRWVAGSEPALVTLPGDEHLLEYDLPADGEGLELFLEARGFYLEWMRQAWLAEESDWKLGKLFTRPATALRDLAPSYHALEPRIEAMFWGSRYVR